MRYMRKDLVLLVVNWHAIVAVSATRGPTYLEGSPSILRQMDPEGPSILGWVGRESNYPGVHAFYDTGTKSSTSCTEKQWQLASVASLPSEGGKLLPPIPASLAMTVLVFACLLIYTVANLASSFAIQVLHDQLRTATISATLNQYLYTSLCTIQHIGIMFNCICM